jgi:N-acetylmuramoyl-L-alanine amidase
LLPTMSALHRSHLNAGIRSESGPTGHHFIIAPAGEVFIGRHINEIGAHSRGYNEQSISVCLLGRMKGIQPYTPTAMRVLSGLVRDLRERFYDHSLHVVGHSQFSSHDCPGFDVDEWSHIKGIIK